MFFLEICNKNVGKRGGYLGAHGSASDLEVVLVIVIKIVHVENIFEEVNDSSVRGLLGMVAVAIEDRLACRYSLLIGYYLYSCKESLHLLHRRQSGDRGGIASILLMKSVVSLT